MLNNLTESRYTPGLEIATTFFQEMLDVYDSLSDLGDRYGHELVVQTHYFTQGLLRDDPSFVDPAHLGLGFTDFIKSLPGSEHYLNYIGRCEMHWTRKSAVSP